MAGSSSEMDERLGKKWAVRFIFNKEQIMQLKAAAELTYEKIPVSEGTQTFTFTARPESVTVFRVRIK